MNYLAAQKEHQRVTGRLTRQSPKEEEEELLKTKHQSRPERVDKETVVVLHSNLLLTLLVLQRSEETQRDRCMEEALSGVQGEH